MKFIYIGLFSLAISSCQDASMLTGKIHVDIKQQNQPSPKIYGVQVDNNQLIVTGKDLAQVSIARLEGSTNHSFVIESRSDGKLILNARNALSILVGQTLNLIVSNASASTAFPITFELPPMGASAGQYLRFNGTAWSPASITNTQIFAGSYDASTDSPDIASIGGTAGSYYIVTVAGTQDLGSGPEIFDVGDWVIFNGSSWFKIEAGQGTPGPTTWSMLLKTGGKVIGSKLSEIADVDVTGIQDGDVIQWNSTDSKWEAVTAPAPTITNGSITTTQIADSAIDSNKIIDGTIVNADISATAAIAQSKISGLSTALNSKEPTIPSGTTADYVRGDKTLGSFASGVLNTLLSGYAAGTAIPITPMDTINQALGKLEAKDAAIITSQGNYLPLDGTSAMTGNLQMGNKLITGLAAPAGDSDAATKKYVDDALTSGGGSSQWTTNGSNIHYDTGNVGVGVLAPAYKLDVAGDVNITGAFKVNGVNIATTGTSPVGAFGGMFAQGSGTFSGSANPYTSAFTCPVGFTSTTLAAAGYNDGSNNFASFNLSYCRAAGGAGGTAAGNDTQFQFNSSGLLAPAEMYYVSTNVGVGVTTPTEKLDVAGNIALTGKVRLKSNTANFVELKAPNGLASTLTLNLPGTNGTFGQALITDGSGTLSWGDVTANTQTAVMSSFAVGTDATVSNTDTLQTALGKVQGQINALKSNQFWGKTGNDISYTTGNVGVSQLCLGGDCRTSWPAGGSSSTGSSSPYAGFPDAITCNNSTMYVILRLMHRSPTIVSYRWHTFDSGGSFTSGTELLLKTDGTYQSNINLAGFDCINKTLDTLKTEGKAHYWGGSEVLTAVLTGYTTGTAIPITPLDTISQALGKLEAQDTALSTAQASLASKQYVDDLIAAIPTGGGSNNTMNSGFPDAIKCIDGANSVYLYLRAQQASGVRWYQYPASIGSDTYYIVYNADGTYNTSTSLGSYDCVSSALSITALTTAGRTYNFTKTSAGGGTNNSMVSGWPDVILCGTGTNKVPLFPSNYNYGGYTYYNQLTNNTYAMVYNSTTGAFHQVTGWASGVFPNCETSISNIMAAGNGYSFAKGPAAQWMQAGTSAYYNAGSVGIGTSSPLAKFEVRVGTNKNFRINTDGSSGTNETRIGASNDDGTNPTPLWQVGSYLGFQTGATSGSIAERMRILANGYVGIGTASPIASLHLNGNMYSVQSISTSGSVYQTTTGIANGTNGRVDSAGGNSTACYNGAWGFWGYCTSLRSTKKDIQDLKLGLDTVLKLRPVSFTWKNNNTEDLGFIAEEVEKVDPLMAEYSKGKLSGVKYSSLTSLLTKAIQELYAEFSGQREEMERLKKENAEMKERLERLEKHMNAR